MGTADGAGNLALGIAAGGFPGTGHFTFLGSDGSLRGKQSYEGLRTPYGQLSGFEGLAKESASYAVLALDADGGLIRRIGNLAAAPGPLVLGLTANDATGGMVVVLQDAIQSYDGAGGLRWSASIGDLGSPHLYAVGADRMGRVLLLFDGSPTFGANSVAGLWVDHDGVRGSIFPAIDFKYVDTWLLIHPRIGGGVFVQERSPLGGHWVRQFDSLASVGAAPPRWLAERGGWRVQIARNGLAYALVPTEDVGGSPGPACTLDVVSPGGKACARVTLTDGTSSCNENGLNVGPDGTLVQTVRASTSCQGDCACTWRWWTGYLR